jgi:hypothetical protein
VSHLQSYGKLLHALARSTPETWSNGVPAVELGGDSEPGEWMSSSASATLWTCAKYQIAQDHGNLIVWRSARTRWHRHRGRPKHSVTTIGPLNHPAADSFALIVGLMIALIGSNNKCRSLRNSTALGEPVRRAATMFVFSASFLLLALAYVSLDIYQLKQNCRDF